ncbi:hypothetical protein O2S95_002255 [Enterococcus faecium]|nr:hypothetical protein [Enterococcus faecium]
MNKRDLKKFQKNIKSKQSNLNNRYIENTEKIFTEIQDLRSSVKTETPNFKKKLITCVLSLLIKLVIIVLISLPLSNQIEIMINNKNYLLDYNLSNYSINSPMQHYQISILPGKENSYQHCFNLNANCYIHEGSIKNLFLVYSQNDKNKFSESDFTNLILENKTTKFHEFMYLLSSLKFLHHFMPSLENTYIKKFNFNCKISYGSADKKMKKNLYLLALDKQNNISINILQVTSTAKIHAVVSPKSKTGGIELNTQEEDPSFKLIKSNDLLSDKFSSQELSEIKTDLSSIMDIFNQYIFVQN